MAFLAGLALLAWLLLGAPLLLDPDSYGWLRTEPSIIDWLNTPDGYTPAAYLACLLTVVVVVLLARSLRLGGRSLLLAAAAAAGLLILILVASFGMRLGWLGTLVPAEVSLSAGVAVWTCSSSC